MRKSKEGKPKTVRYNYDPGNPPLLSPDEEAQMAKAASLKPEDIDTSDAPEITDEEWKLAVRGNPFLRAKKVATAVRLDADVVHWLKSKGRGYQTRLNSYLRQMMMDEIKTAQGH